MLKISFTALSLLVVVAGLSGCGSGSSTKAEVVELNKVIDAFEATMAALDGAEGEAGAEGADTIAPVASANEDKEKTTQFLTAFASELNKAKVHSKSVGVSMNASGSIEGFTDANGNMSRDGNDERVFMIEIDSERDRLIASTTTEGDTYHRPYHYRPGGMFMGYMLGSMMGRSSMYYGAPGRARPNYGSM